MESQNYYLMKMAVKDFIYFCYMIGNDFHHLPGIEIKSTVLILWLKFIKMFVNTKDIFVQL